MNANLRNFSLWLITVLLLLALYKCGRGTHAMAYEDHWLPGFNFNVEEWFEGNHYETLAICRSLGLARAAFAAAIAEKPAARFMIRQRTRVVKRLGGP